MRQWRRRRRRHRDDDDSDDDDDEEEEAAAASAASEKERPRPTDLHQTLDKLPRFVLDVLLLPSSLPSFLLTLPLTYFIIIERMTSVSDCVSWPLMAPLFQDCLSFSPTPLSSSGGAPRINNYSQRGDLLMLISPTSGPAPRRIRVSAYPRARYSTSEREFFRLRAYVSYHSAFSFD